MSVIYIDLGCSDGQSVARALAGGSACFDLAHTATEVYAFDPIRHSDWDKFDSATYISNPKFHFYECAVGIADGLSWLSMNENTGERTILQANKNYEACQIRRRVKVINFPEWFREHVKFEDTVIVKMDIAGAEYVILDSLIASKLINRINHLFVEFNSGLIIEEKKDAYIDAEKDIRANCPVEIHPFKLQ